MGAKKKKEKEIKQNEKYIIEREFVAKISTRELVARIIKSHIKINKI